MAAIGRIRKHGVLLMVIIGVALLAFIIGDLTKITPSITNQNLMAKVDGEKMRVGGSENTYSVYYNQNRELMMLVQGTSTSDDEIDQQIHSLSWQQVKQEILLGEELADMGIIFTDEMIDNINTELIASLSAPQPQTNAQYYLWMMANRIQTNNPNVTRATLVGVFESIDDYRTKDVRMYNAYKAIERMAVLEAKNQAYFGLINGSLYFSEPIKKQIAADNKIATMQLATIDVTNPSFDKIKVTVTDEEIKEYFDAHKDRFFVKENNRDLDIAVFPIIPTTQDRKDIADTVNQIYQRFSTATNLFDFARSEKRIDKDRLFSNSDGSFWSYNDAIANHVQIDTLMYLAKGHSALQTYGLNQETSYSLPPVLDSIVFKSQPGTMIAPYLDGNFWYFGKVRDIQMRPDSILTTFLTIDYKTPENSTPTRTKEQAQILVDSLQQMLQTSPDPKAIFSLLPSYKNERIFQTDSTYWFKDVPDTLYNKLIATTTDGLYLHETPGGFLLFKVLQKTQSIEKRQYLLFPVPIQASDKTYKELESNAKSLAISCENVDKLDELAKSKGATVIKKTNITNMQGAITTDQGYVVEKILCRNAISWAFDKETEIGKVSPNSYKGRYKYTSNQQYSQESQLGPEVFLVVGLRNAQERGEAEFENVKEIIKEELTAQKKREAIEKQLQGELAKSTITELASKYNARSADSLKINLYQPNASGIENSAIGKIYTLATQTPSTVSGKNAVYLVNIYNIEDGKSAPDLNMETNILYETVLGRSRNIEQIVMDELESKVSIDDRRQNFYKGDQ